MRIKDELGKQYGYLTVIEQAPSKGGRAQWKCQCKCGKEIIVYGKSLRTGHTKSCGCYSVEKTIAMNMDRGGGDLTGCTFGNLTVKEFSHWKDHGNGHKDRMWLCDCKCGNTCIINHRYLRNGNTKSCGCIKSQGETLVDLWLKEHNIIFKREYTFKDLKSTKNTFYRFDFAIFNNENQLLCLIEYQGNIHFQTTNSGWNNEQGLEDCQRRDKIKADYCKNNNIMLHYITYKENIEDRLKEIFNE